MSPDFFDSKCRNSSICGEKVGEKGVPFPKVSTLSTRSSSVDADFFYKAQFDTENNAVGWKFSATVQWFS